MRRQLLPALLMTIVMTLLLGLAYPVVVFAVGQVAFKDRANGSLVEVAGTPVGSALLGQRFTKPEYFHPRPSVAGDGYDGLASSASNLGPGNPDLLKAIEERVAAYRKENDLPSTATVPVDAVTASASGLDPQITPANARIQAARVATARGLSVDDVLAAVERHTQGRQWGFLGEKGVNVLELNLDLDRGR
jgi:K+-transporting ATPase ATPase C chain